MEIGAKGKEFLGSVFPYLPALWIQCYENEYADERAGVR